MIFELSGNRIVGLVFYRQKLKSRIIETAAKTESQTEIEIGDLFSFKMIPDRSCFIIVFGIDSAGTRCEGKRSRQLHSGLHIPVAPVAGAGSRFCPFIGISIYQPPVTI